MTLILRLILVLTLMLAPAHLMSAGETGMAGMDGGAEAMTVPDDMIAGLTEVAQDCCEAASHQSVSCHLLTGLNLDDTASVRIAARGAARLRFSEENLAGRNPDLPQKPPITI